EAVVGLPEKLFYGTGIPASILILNKHKPKERQGHVLFIDASPAGFYHEGKNRNMLRLEDILRIASVCHAWAEPERVSEQIDKLATEWTKARQMHRKRPQEPAANAQPTHHV